MNEAHVLTRHVLYLKYLFVVLGPTKKFRQLIIRLIMLKYELEYRTLKLLEERPDMTQRQLSQALGVSLGKAHYVVKALIDVGWIKLGNFRRSNQKLGYAYLLTPSGITEKSAITAKFLARKQCEYDALRDEIAQLKKELRQQNFVSEPPT